MLEIAVCDDDMADLERAVTMLHKIFTSQKIAYHIEKFMSANQMLENISRIDIGILDISMEELNGIKLGRKLKEKFPDLKLPEEHRPIGKYGRMHREYLREVHPARLNTLTLTGELWTYLADLNEQAQKRLGTIIEQMKAAEGVTEELKSICQMEWVQRCNNIHNRAEEIVLHEMIYS